MLFSRSDVATVTDILRAAAAAEIMPRFRRLAAGAVREKTSALDLVTDADEAAERMITADLLKAFPGAVIVGEEATEKDPRRLDAIADAELCFVVDPVDGTKNFASGLTLFGVMAAAVVKGEVVAGIILDPVGNDVAIGWRGEGAWIEAPDGHHLDLKVAPPAPLAEMNGAVSLAWFPEPLKTTVARNLPRVAAAFAYRCAAHEYRLAAGGHCHFLVFNKLMPWDHAPGWLIHREAGGYSARFDGSPYLPSHSTGGLIAAPDRDSWLALRDGLFTPASA